MVDMILIRPLNEGLGHLVPIDVGDITGLHSFSRCCLPKSRIPTKFVIIAVQGHPRSSTLVSIESSLISH